MNAITWKKRKIPNTSENPALHSLDSTYQPTRYIDWIAFLACMGFVQKSVFQPHWPYISPTIFHHIEGTTHSVMMIIHLRRSEGLVHGHLGSLSWGHYANSFPMCKLSVSSKNIHRIFCVLIKYFLFKFSSAKPVWTFSSSFFMQIISMWQNKRLTMYLCTSVEQLWCKMNLLSIHSLSYISGYFYLQEGNIQFKKPRFQVTVFPRDNFQWCAIQLCNSKTCRNSAFLKAQIPGFHIYTLFLTPFKSVRPVRFHGSGALLELCKGSQALSTLSPLQHSEHYWAETESHNTKSQTRNTLRWCSTIILGFEMHYLTEEQAQTQNNLESYNSSLWNRIIIISFSVRHMSICDTKSSLNFSAKPHITVLELEQSFEYFFPRNFRGRRADQCKKLNNQYQPDSYAANAVKGDKELLILHQTWFSCDLLHFYSKITQLDSLRNFSF